VSVHLRDPVVFTYSLYTAVLRLKVQVRVSTPRIGVGVGVAVRVAKAGVVLLKAMGSVCGGASGTGVGVKLGCSRHFVPGGNEVGIVKYSMNFH